MNRHITYQINENENGWSIEHFLRANGYSNPIIVHLKKTKESIIKNGIWSYMRDKLCNGDVLEVHIIEDMPSENIVSSPISLDEFKKLIVYEDEDLLVINKPPAMPVHPSIMHFENTLANYCAYYYNTLMQTEGEFVYRCVNRLDKDTSGLVLIAKNMLSSASLFKQQQTNDIHRTYLAIAEGKVNSQGTINLPIAKREDSAIERYIDYDKGEKAITHYECLKSVNISGDIYSLVRLQLETGRTHQIRVHMKAISHPLIGDFLYNPRFTRINRQALHSYSLEFKHPITGKDLFFKANPPSDFDFIMSKCYM